MQKTDLELQYSILQAIDDAAHNWINGYEMEAAKDFLETLSECGYKIVKDNSE